LLELSPGQVIELDPNGFSRFGNVYAGPLAQMPREALSREQRRERDLEVIRQWRFPHRRSRLHSVFAAPTLEEAERHAFRMNNAKDSEARIFEVFADSNNDPLDVMWLDIVGLDDAQMQRRYAQYWTGMKSSDIFFGATSPRPPLLEVLLPLPLRLGEVVTRVRRNG
jgi:hypothetical protein